MLLIETEKFSAAAFMPQTPPEYSVWTVLPQGNGEALFALLPEPKPALICVSADWNRDLSPWFAPKAFRGGKDFSGGADAFLQNLSENIIPFVENELNITNCKRIIAGYSLAGLFALWASCQTDRFAGIAAVSPSVWFPGFLSYVKEYGIASPVVYLSLGDREERTKNQVMAAVGDCIRELYGWLQEQEIDSILEWNPGNHFKDPGIRTAKAFAWVMERTK